MPFRKVPETEWQMITNKVRSLEKELQQVRQDQRTKVPIYDYSNLPVDAVEGQVAVLDNAPPPSVSGGSGGTNLPFAIAQRKAVSVAANNSQTDSCPHDNFDATDSSVFVNDTNGIKIVKNGLYRVESWIEMGSLTSSIPTTIYPNMYFNYGGITAPNAAADQFFGINKYVPGHLTGVPSGDSWQMQVAGYLSVGAQPFLLNAGIFGNGGTAMNGKFWNADWWITTAIRMGDAVTFDLSVYGN